MSKKVLCIFIGLAILAGSLVACGSPSDNTGALTTPGATQAPAKHFKVGDVVKVGNTWEITVNSVQTLTNDGDSYLHPKDGDVYLAINVTTKNISSSEQKISSLLNFSLKGSDGTKYNQTALISQPAAPDGKVEVGDQDKGDLAYEVPASVKAFVLSFQADLTAAGQTQWDLSV